MIKSIRYIIPIVLGLLCFSVDSFSQTPVGKKLDNQVLEAVAHLCNDEYEPAKKLLQEVLAVDPTCDAAWYYLGQVSIMQYDVTKASECYTMAAELDPNNFWYRCVLAKLNALMSQPTAIQLYEQIVKDFPENTDVYYELLDLYTSNGRYDDALKVIEKIEQEGGLTDQMAIHAFRIFYAQGRTEEGIEYLRKFNDKYSSPIVLSVLADYELENFNDTLAIKYYDEALDLDPTMPTALSGMAEAYRMGRRYKEFFPYLDRFIECPSADVAEKVDYLDALVNKSDPLFVKKYSARLDTTMQKLSQAHPKDSLVYGIRGFYYYVTGRKDASVEQFRECAVEFPESSKSRAMYLEILMYDGRWEELAEEGRKAFDSFPEEIVFLEMAGVADYNLEEYDKLLNLCDKVLELAPNDSSTTLRTWSTKGDVYHLLGESKKAYKAYDKALKINPDYVYVLNNYAYYLSVEGIQLKKAYLMSRKTVDAEPENPTYLDTFGWILYLRGDYTEAKSFFKQAMLYGGKESAVILDHYAEVLYALREYDLAFVYWNMAQQKNENNEVPGLKEKVEQKRKESGR